MKILIEFDVDFEGNITEAEAADIFFRQIALENNIIVDEEKDFSIIVNGWREVNADKLENLG